MSLKKKVSKSYEMVGNSGPINHIKEIIEKVAPTEARVLMHRLGLSWKESKCMWRPSQQVDNPEMKCQYIAHSLQSHEDKTQECCCTITFK